MKVILTESQAKMMLIEARLAYLLQESLNESKTFDEMKSIIKKALATGVAITTVLAAIDRLSVSDSEKRALANAAEQTEQVDSTYLKKVQACEDYMKIALKNQGFDLGSTGLKPETLVSVAESRDFDLPFLMAAAHLESCFGATPRAKKTNSVFSVGCYDNGKDAVTYADPNDSVDAYVNLLNNHYLVGGKTIYDLMAPGQFVNELGKRYASNKAYEGKIKAIRNSIIRRFPELAS
jgi:flagellum-specific peptidoglycan hydrolase FlgJ